jgi:hypothetical protein
MDNTIKVIFGDSLEYKHPVCSDCKGNIFTIEISENDDIILHCTRCSNIINFDIKSDLYPNMDINNIRVFSGRELAVTAINSESLWVPYKEVFMFFNEYYALRAKVERLEKWNDIHQKHIAALQSEVEQSKGDPDSYDNIYKNNIRLRAEVDSLKQNIELLVTDKDNCAKNWYNCRADLAAAVVVLQQYADPNNWGYYDDSGCEKGRGSGEDACFIGPGEARALLSRLEVKP